ncbi:hypothetical protein SAMN04488505_10196 [Chitinophaga rupis]|uniref:Uncharacterized protein n=1 Tax=Chitinophaga rupis TaxID=573321 RepID=A0A1H7GK94_9BACT|nr:hypothetical protein SAMN04488505_10196 [Chitinophaga rupis]
MINVKVKDAGHRCIHFYIYHLKFYIKFFYGFSLRNPPTEVPPVLK